MSQSSPTPDPVAWMVRSGAGHSIGQPELVEPLARGNAERYNRLAGWRDKPYTVVPLYDQPSALPATTPSAALEASPMVCACGHVHATAIQDGVTSVFHRCRFDGCACRAYRPPFAPEPAPQPCSHCDATGDLNGEPCGACLGSGLATPAIIPIVALLESCADDREQEAQDSLDRTPEAFGAFMDDARLLREHATRIRAESISPSEGSAPDTPTVPMSVPEHEKTLWRLLAAEHDSGEQRGLFMKLHHHYGALTRHLQIAEAKLLCPPSAPDTKPDDGRALIVEAIGGSLYGWTEMQALTFRRRCHAWLSVSSSPPEGEDTSHE